MTETVKPTRREILMSSLLLPLAAGRRPRLRLPRPHCAGGKHAGGVVLPQRQHARHRRPDRRDLQADLFEIEPARLIRTTISRLSSRRGRSATGTSPPLAATVSELAAYETVYLGFPIWGATAPPIIRSFLAGHDLAGKTIVPFNLHGGYGLGNSREVIAQAAPQARFAEGFVMEGLQERRTTERVRQWLATRAWKSE